MVYNILAKCVNSHDDQGSHISLKVLEFFFAKFKALKVLENRTGA